MPDTELSMIPRTGLPWQVGEWRKQLATAARDAEELLRRLDFPAAAIRRLLPAARAAARDFPLRVPDSFIARMKPADSADPLLRQVLPLDAELAATPGFVADPLAEQAAMVAPGLLHKYAARALLVTTPACAVHCRYCFRRHFPYAESRGQADHWRAAIDWLAARPDMEEIILSGGDPLTLSTARLGELLAALRGIPHLRRLRLHTRLPIVLPQRVDEELLKLLAGQPWPVTVVVHANHPNELGPEQGLALAALRRQGITLLNQSVLLAGVNDHADTLCRLSVRLHECGVLPCYLHLLDPVAGAAHFAVEARRAQALYRDMAARLPGYLLPRLAREDAGAPGKTLLGPTG